MELPGSSYTYTIATLSITYAALIFRQIIGGSVSSYDFCNSFCSDESYHCFFRNAAAGTSAFRFAPQYVVWRVPAFAPLSRVGLV